MKNWLKENWFKTLLMLAIFVFLYLQLVRPIIYKKYCANKAYNTNRFDLNLSIEDRDDLYKLCLRKYGL